MTLSMCSSRYCSTFAPLIFLYFGAIVVFLGFFDFLFLFFDIFSSHRSTKEVTTKNMSLNKWKAWPVENSVDELQIYKKLVTTKIGSCGQFLSEIIFFEPDKAEKVSRVLILVAGLFTYPVPDISSDVNCRSMIRKRLKLAHSNTTQMTLSMCSSRYCSTFATLFFLYFWAIVVFWDSLTFSFYFFDIFLHLGA